MQAYGKFVQVVIDQKVGGLITASASDFLTGKIKSVGKLVPELKKGMVIQFDRRKSVEHPSDGIKYYYVTAEGIIAYENNK